MEFRETELTDEIIRQLIALSEDWTAENSCWGYRPNTASDIQGRRLFCAFQGSTLIGYLFGVMTSAERTTSVMPEGTPYFEVEELYIRPPYRSQGIGRRLFTLLEDSLHATNAEYILLSTATKNYRAILHFYIEEMGMEFWSAQLFKRLK